MITTAPLRKSIHLILCLVLMIVAANVHAQRRGRGKPQKQTISKATGLVDEADKLAEDKKYAEALETYKIAIRLDPNYSPAFGGLGDAYLNTGNSQQAEVAYKEQVRLAPNDADAQYDLGYFFNAMGRHGEAFSPLVKATSIDPTFAEAFYGLGYAYSRGTEFEKSIGFYRSAIKSKPDYGDAYYGLGEAYARLGKADLANEQLKRLNTLDPRLARKLEKEIPTALAAAHADKASETTTQTAQPQTSTAPIIAPNASQTSSQTPAEPAARKVDEIKPQSKPEAPAKTTTEPTSRQLQQLPPAQPPPPSSTTTTASSAAPATTQSNEVRALPVSAKRWALVIGVDKYVDPQISPLKGSDNDARQIADALIRFAGFPQDQVILLSTNQPVERQPTRVNILRRLSNLSTTVPKDGMLLVSFAGHGMERGGQAFLLPADAQISDQISFLEETAISMTRVKSWIKETGVSQVLLLLDACRNDPGGRADAPNPMSNAYVNAFNFDVRNKEVQAFATMYATGIGQRAYEYTEKKQGYFSWAVVEGLKGAAANDKGEVTLSQLVKYVQDAVPKRIAVDLGSTKQQKPFAVIEGYRADELVLAVTNAASNTTSNVPGQINTVDPAAIELAFWDTIKNSNNPNDFKSYLDKYPDGQFAELAKSRSTASRPSGGGGGGDSVEMMYWGAIKDSKNPADFRAYTTKFPGGLFVELANSRIASLEAEAHETAKARASTAADERIRNTHIFDVLNEGRTDGSLTVAPGTLTFEPKKANGKKNMTIQCSQIKRVENGKSALQPPHVNIYLNSPAQGGEKKDDTTIVFWTSSGGQGLFVNKPVVDITANVLNAIIDACKMARINQ